MSITHVCVRENKNNEAVYRRGEMHGRLQVFCHPIRRQHRAGATYLHIFLTKESRYKYIYTWRIGHALYWHCRCLRVPSIAVVPWHLQLPPLPMCRSAFVHADLIPREECEPSKRKGIHPPLHIEQVDSVHGLLNGFASAKNPCSISSQYLRILKHAPSTSRTDPESIRQQYYILLLLLLLPRHNVILLYTH